MAAMRAFLVVRLVACTAVAGAFSTLAPPSRARFHGPNGVGDRGCPGSSRTVVLTRGSGSHSRSIGSSHSNRISSRTALGVTLYPVSGVDGWPLVQQQLMVGAILGGLGVGTVALSTKGFATLEAWLPDGWFAAWKWNTWPLLGVVYVLAGLAHFGVEEAFVGIVPPRGTWGLWYLPGSAEFHVAWTGVAELLGGTGLLLGGIGRVRSHGDGNGDGNANGNGNDNADRLVRVSAASLAVLTVAVTPANIYMYTHGAIMVGAGPEGPVALSFHVVRFVLQILLLAILTGLATTSPSPGTRDGIQE